ncbi:MAG: hypothetical protein KGL39_00270 [Patescibacteria group bacterium]|nr:hypothetical protein [Patescibacteria group bacterium]
MIEEKEFSVFQYFPDGSYEQVKRFVGSEEAVKEAIQLASSVGAHIGTTQRVIITDGGDYCVWEWKHDLGITFPPEVAGKLKPI